MGDNLKPLGILLVIAGIALAAFAFSMDTTVSTDSISVGETYIPSQQVNNIGLMNERQNYLIGAGFLVLIGVVLIVAGGQGNLTASDTRSEPLTDLRKCPQCAEYIKREAKICKHCGFDLTPILAAEAVAARDRSMREQEEVAREADEQQARLAEWAVGAPRRRRVAIVTTVVVAGILLAGLVVTRFVIPPINERKAYAAASSALQNGDFEEASEAFADLGDYKDSPRLRLQAKSRLQYEEAVSTMRRSIPSAAGAFDGISDDYKDTSRHRATIVETALLAGRYDTTDMNLSGYAVVVPRLQDQDVVVEILRTGTLIVNGSGSDITLVGDARTGDGSLRGSFDGKTIKIIKMDDPGFHLTFTRESDLPS